MSAPGTEEPSQVFGRRSGIRCRQPALPRSTWPYHRRCSRAPTRWSSRVQFAALHESASGTKQEDVAVQQVVRY